ncbi:MAG: hypothetical protein A2259_03930 [Candidatus Moranbacteria bacterium RIFOXYA2_FULL_43_15]|nr:MAG: hypothetical protein A2259_03930 [Candidatus Moranbacteria bacterium RIFOXYA2_FULL_43_15]
MNDILDNLAKEVDKISEKDISSEPAKAEAVTSEPKKEEDKPVSAMDAFMSQISYPEVGDNITGKVIEVSSSEIYVDLAPFGTGIVLGKEIKDGMGGGKVKIGDEISAAVMETENEDGFIELSIREASYERAWEDIEEKRIKKEKVATKIISANKGGLLVEVNGISGFLPVSQLSSTNYPRVEDGDRNKILNLLKKLVGKELEVRILDADREAEKLIVSEKAAQSEKDKKIISNLHVGDVISGEISGVVDFGAFVKFSPAGAEDSSEEKLEGLAHISELAWQLIEDPRTIVKAGDKVEAKIIGIDNDKISLSLRALQKDPWSAISEKYNVGDIVKGTVNKINHFGAFVYLDKDIHGLAHISEMSEAYPGKTLEELIKLGESYSWKILSIEPKTHRMGLVLVLAGKKKKEKESEKEEKNTPQATEDKQNDTEEKKDVKKKEVKEKKTKKKVSKKKAE